MINSCKENRIRPLSILIMVYCALIPLENVLVASIGGSINKYIGLLIAGFISLWIICKRDGIKIHIGEFKCVLAFAGLALISFFWTLGDTGNSYHSMLFNITIFTFIFIQYPLYEKERKMIYFGMIIVGVILAVIMFSGGQTVNVNDISGGRVTLVFGGLQIDNNNLAVALSIPLIASFGLITGNIKKAVRLLCVGAAIVILLAILLTGSRGGLLALIVGLTACVIKVNNGIKVRTIIVSAVLVLTLLIVMQYFLSEGIASRFTLNSVISSGGTGRFLIWEHIIDAFKDSNIFRELFGYGYSMQARVLQNTWGFYTAAHNDFLQVLLDLGVVGLIVYIRFWVKSISYAIRVNRYIELGLLFTLLFSSMSMEILVKKMLWLVIYLVFVPTKDIHRD